MGFPSPFKTNACIRSTKNRETLAVFYRRAPEMHTDGLLGGREYRRNLWGTNMSLSDATAAYRRAGLARDTADSATISTPVDGYKRTNRAANSMGMITIDEIINNQLEARKQR